MLRAAEPEEGCALLLGRQRQTTLELERIWPCCNRWLPAEERNQRFQLDPREQLLAQRWARQHDLQVLGAAHSHPSSGAEPSATDLALACGPSLMLIRSGLGGPRALRAWWLPEDAGWGASDGQAAPGQPHELAIVPDPGEPTAAHRHLGE